MAGFYVTIGDPDPRRTAAAAQRLKFFEETMELVHDGPFAAAWVGHDDQALFGPAQDPATGVCVITSGRVSWEEAQWQEATGMRQYDGGLSNRLLLDRYLAKGITGIERHNGPAALIVWDRRNQVLHLLTDHFGYHPVFLYRSENPDQTVISTFSDAIARDPGISVTDDEISMAEFLSAWRITPPHTYYQEIKHAGAATHWCWDVGKHTCVKRCYWTPFQQTPFADINAAAEELSSAVKNAIRIRTLPRLGPIVSYTSGGMDSRAVLFSAASKPDLIALNLYDVPNKEAAISKRLAEAAGARYVGFGRDEDYYPRWLSPGAALSGSMWSAEDNHFLGTRKLVNSFGARTVMTACTADWLFKGYGLEKDYRRLFGRNLPLKEFRNERVLGFLPNYPRPGKPPFDQPVRQRLEEWFQGTPLKLESDRDRLLVEDKRIRPACYTVSVSGQIMYRAFPYDTFLADHRIADCYCRTRAEWKLNSDLWGKAVERICRGGRGIVDANFGWKIGSSSSRKLLMFGIGWCRRRLKPSRFKRDGLATDGSWPNLSWLINHSATLSELWSAPPEGTRRLMARLWGEDPWAKPLSQWTDASYDVFRILTLLEHLKLRV